MTAGIYIHIPFCASKCHYCSFFSVPHRDNAVQIDRYFKALEEEIKLFAKKHTGVTISSIYIGGGTPSVVDKKHIAAVLKVCFLEFDTAEDIECTLEANPATMSIEKIREYINAGVNRLSIGAQSFSDNALTFLGRTHKAQDISSSVDMCRDEGLKNISIDLMFGYKGQTLKSWEKDIDKVRSMNINHVSLYDLSVEEGSQFFRRKDKDELVLSDSVYLKMYDLIADSLGQDFYHYEISNFAKTPDDVSRHNMLYWGNRDYLGFGAGAFSYFLGERWSNVRDISLYSNKLEKGIFPISDSEKLSPDKMQKETFVLNLRRLKEGASLKHLEKQTGLLFDAEFKRDLDKLVLDKLLIKNGNSYFLTKKGISLFNQVAVTLI